MTRIMEHRPIRIVGLALITALIMAVTPTALTLPAYAEDPTLGPPGLSVAPIAPTYAGQQRTVQVTATDPADQPLPNVEVQVERSAGTTWSPLAVVTTDASGTAWLPVTVARTAAANLFRASLIGQSPIEFRIGLLRRTSVLTLAGPSRVIDERTMTWTMTWKATSGEPVSGPVTLQRRIGSGPWRTVAARTTDAAGRASVRLTPREDSHWRVQASAREWVLGGTSAPRVLNNVAPGVPVKFPRRAPKPRVKLPAQPRAVGVGPNATITVIPNRIWRQMVGRTWRPGCPVGRSHLRLIEVNYWDFTGYRRRGQLVVNVDVAGQIAAAMSDLYRAKVPLRSVARPDRFGWSARVRGANDYRSMAADNSSAFNCRDVVGRLGVRSPHAWGRSLDLNPWENPYRSAKGVVPNTWWVARSNPRVAWRNPSHIVVRIMKRHGLRWTYGLRDLHHFDAIPARGGTAREAAANPATPVIRCGALVCD